MCGIRVVDQLLEQGDALRDDRRDHHHQATAEILPTRPNQALPCVPLRVLGVKQRRLEETLGPVAERLEGQGTSLCRLRVFSLTSSACAIVFAPVSALLVLGVSSTLVIFRTPVVFVFVFVMVGDLSTPCRVRSAHG